MFAPAGAHSQAVDALSSSLIGRRSLEASAGRQSLLVSTYTGEQILVPEQYVRPHTARQDSWCLHKPRPS